MKNLTNALIIYKKNKKKINFCFLNQLYKI